MSIGINNEFVKADIIGGSGDSGVSAKSAVTVTNFSQADLGDNPAINLATGRLRYSFKDLEVGHGNFAVGVSHAYLSSINTSFASKFNYCGKNWKLDVSQCIVKDGAYVLYLDAKGEVHRFVNFDGNRYYDERNAKTTLTYDSQGESVISDGVGNKLYFNANGYVSKSVACHSSAMVKRFTYDSGNRITSVYDERTAPKNRITFSYADGLLSAITSYVNDKQTFKITYGYDGSKNLVTVHKSAFNASLQESKKQLLAMSYAGGYLNTVTDCETKSAQRFTFKDDKICKVEQGVIREYGFALGMTDANGNPLTLGTIECGSITEKFEELDATQYAYNTESDGISVETDITNKNGITLAYFIDRNACITSSFEKTSTDGLKTLTKQGAKRTGNIAGSNSAKAVNSSNCYSTSGVLQVLNDTPFDVTRSDKEKTARVFDYSFWLKIHNECNYLQAKATYKFKNGDVKTSTVLINGKAKDAWQKVSLPLVAPKSSDDAKTETLDYLKIGLIDNNEYYALLYDVAEIGFAPAISSTLYLTTSDGNGLPLSQADTFTLTQYESSGLVDKTYSINEATFFTENDVIATFTNKFINEGQEYFDVICNNGTKRIKVSDFSFGFSTGDSSDDSKSPVRVTTTLSNGKTVKTYYKFNLNEHYIARGMFIETIADVNTEENTTSSTLTVVDYCGQKLLEIDEYGVGREYFYDNYGDLQITRIKASDGTLGAQTVYFYIDGKLVNVQDDLSGRDFTYNDHGKLASITDCKQTNNGMTKTTHKVINSYDVFNEKPLSVTESNDGLTIANNAVTYSKGLVRTVSDGLSKYGIRYNPVTFTVEYTKFDSSDNEYSVQTDLITDISNGKKHINVFVNGDGAQNDYVATETDNYGFAQKIYSGKTPDDATDFDTATQKYLLDYHLTSESAYAAKVARVHDRTNDEYTDYARDNDGNLSGWTEYKGFTQRLPQFQVQQPADNSTKYVFNGVEEYFTDTEYDKSVIISPRISKVLYYSDNNPRGDTNRVKITEFSQSYSYDKFGRLTSTYSSDNNHSSKYIYKDNTSRVHASEYKNYTSSQQNSSSVNKLYAYDEISYNKSGDVDTVTHDVKWNNGTRNCTHNCTKTYGYDGAHRLTSERDTALGINQSYSYNTAGRLKDVTYSDGTSKQFVYDSFGRLSSVSGNGSPRYFGYDNYGNRTSDAESNAILYGYRDGSKLIKVQKVDDGSTTTIAEYRYNVNGVRNTKIIDGKTTRYFVDGNKIIGERQTKIVNLIDESEVYNNRYFYDVTGLIGLKRNGYYYRYVKDIQGNVAFIVRPDGIMMARYEYDAFGNCKVYDHTNQLNTNPDFIGNTNPFRWKCFYYDTETGLYYANGNYYDPTTGLYVNARPIADALDCAYTTGCIDRSSPVCNNIVESNTDTSANDLNTISEVSFNVFDALPTIPQWLAVSTSVLSDILSLSVYVRTAWYMRKTLGLANLMKLDGVIQLPGKYTNFINKLAYGFVALNTVLDILTNLKNGKTAGYVLASAIYTAVTGIGIVWTSGIIGTKVGAKVGGAGGAILGGFVGLVVGAALSFLSNWLKWRIFK